MNLDAVNDMDAADFIAAFGDVAENSHWVAAEAERARPFGGPAEMIAAFHRAVRNACEDKQLALLRAHPDLAGRTAVAGEIGADSATEQAGAGLDRLTPEEFAVFTELNRTYRARFGFPFILAVRGATKHDILQAFSSRLDNDRATEIDTAVAQVCRIIGFRLEERLGQAGAATPS